MRFSYKPKLYLLGSVFLASTVSGAPERRWYNPDCKMPSPSEQSCYEITGNCLWQLKERLNNFPPLWSIDSCAIAATCFGLVDLIDDVNCQFGLNLTPNTQPSLVYDIYAAAVGDCAWAPGGCPMTRQNYIDWYYGTLTTMGSNAWPSSAAVVIGYWDIVVQWTKTGQGLPYLNFNDYLHFSGRRGNTPSQPTPTTIVTTVSGKPTTITGILTTIAGTPTIIPANNTTPTPSEIVTTVSGKPTTITGILTTISGSPTIIPGTTPLPTITEVVTTISGVPTTVTGILTTISGSPTVIPISGIPTTISGTPTTVSGILTTISGSPTIIRPTTPVTTTVVTTVSGTPTTVTGVLTTISGTPTIIPITPTPPPGGVITTTIGGTPTTVPGIVTTIAGVPATIPAIITTILGTPTTIPAVVTTVAGTVTLIPGNVQTVSGTPTIVPGFPYPRQTMTWNPNASPTAGATSETLVLAGTTSVVAIPASSVTIQIGGAPITLAPGGEPIGPTPAGLSIPGAATPTFEMDPFIPASVSARSVTFVSGTWTSIVPAPTSASAPILVNGPPDDGNLDPLDDAWFLILGVLGTQIRGRIPPTVVIIGGIVAFPIPPPGWPDDGSWEEPEEDNDDEDEDEGDKQCNTPMIIPNFDVSLQEMAGPDYDPEFDDELVARNLVEKRSHRILVTRDSDRNIVLGNCRNTKFSAPGPNLGLATWYSLDAPTGAVATAATILHPHGNTRRAAGRVAEHLFEFRFIKDFFNNQFNMQTDCAWLQNNAWDNVVPGIAPASSVKAALQAAIDQLPNLVWADTLINKAKSSTANNWNTAADNPPYKERISHLVSLDSTIQIVNDNATAVETMIRSLAVLDQYFNMNAPAFSATAGRVQDILARLTPETPIFPPLDTRFQNYMQQTFSQYTQRVRFRAQNTLTEYRNRLNTLLAQAVLANPPGNPPPVIPQCWSVYYSPTISTSINQMNVNFGALIPLAIPHPACNTAGTTGPLFFNIRAGIRTGFNNNPRFRIMATGTSLYNLGFVNANGAASPYFDVDMSTVWNARYGPQCSNVHWISLAGAGQNAYPPATWDLNCGANTGKAPAGLRLISGGAPLECFFDNLNLAGSVFEILCGPSQNTVQQCLDHITLVDGQAPRVLSVPDLTFQGI